MGTRLSVGHRAARPGCDRVRAGGGAPVSLPLTPSQTIGPFLAIGLPWPDGPFVVPEGTPGAISISGLVLDGAAEPVTDAMIETWQAAPDGSFAHPDDPRGPGAAGFLGLRPGPSARGGRGPVITP